MPSRANPKVRTLVDGESFDTQAQVDRINENNELIQMKFGNLTHDDFSTSTQTTVLLDGVIDMMGNQVSNVAQIRGASDSKFINLQDDGRQLDAIVLNEVSPIVFIPPGYTHEITRTVVMKSNVQIIGSGPSSVIKMSSTSGGRTPGTAAQPGFPIIQVNTGIKRWALRDFRMVGRRGYGLTTGTGIKIVNARTTDGEMDNLFLGPVIDGAQSNALHRAIEISGSSGIRMSGLVVRQCSNTAISMRSASYAASPVIDVSVLESIIHQNSDVAIYVSNAKDIKISGNMIHDNGDTNIYLNRAQRTIISRNQIENASTGSARTDPNILVTGSATTKSVGTVVFGNAIVDRPTKTSIRHVHLATNSNSAIIRNNVFNFTSSGSGAAKRVILDNSSVVSRDDNILEDRNSMSFVPQTHANRVTWQNWKSLDLAPGAVSAGPYGNINNIKKFKRQYGMNLAHPGDTYSVEQESYTRKVHEFWVEHLQTWIIRVYTGNLAGFSRTLGSSLFGTDDVIQRCGNPGTLLTPERIMSESTNLRHDVRGVIATYNLGPTVTYLSDGSMSSVYTPKNIMGSPATSTYASTVIFPPLLGSASGMQNGVLSAHFTGLSYLRIDGNITKGDVQGTPTIVTLGRPTWAKVMF